MAVSDAWLSRGLRESVRDRGPLTASQCPDIYAFAKRLCVRAVAAEGWVCLERNITLLPAPGRGDNRREGEVRRKRQRQRQRERDIEREREERETAHSPARTKLQETELVAWGEARDERSPE
ncbi:unnamed protein product [Pleuronectes platessa]|uniref:Uncharacterized protein n=1 Tax=Pleuronectes platessa TaxID=8262 RepID=A0A9N7TRV3_PLEPL|nr:unnamed protein product [Pleuronectes platessa]